MSSGGYRHATESNIPITSTNPSRWPASSSIEAVTQSRKSPLTLIEAATQCRISPLTGKTHRRRRRETGRSTITVNQRSGRHVAAIVGRSIITVNQRSEGLRHKLLMLEKTAPSTAARHTGLPQRQQKEKAWGRAAGKDGSRHHHGPSETAEGTVYPLWQPVFMGSKRRQEKQ